MRLRFLGYSDSAYQESPYRPDELTSDAIPKRCAYRQARSRR